MSAEFEKKLLELNFKIKSLYHYCCDNNDKKCSNEETIVIYVQEPSELYSDVVKNINLYWEKRYICEDCIDEAIGSLLCGGHYNNLVIYKDGIDIGNDYELCEVDLDSEITSNDEE